MARRNEEYDIGLAFQAIEDELIHSMIRNMRRHKQEEIKENRQWSMWQVEELQSLEQYKRQNQKYKAQFKNINDLIEELIRQANEEGQMDQETEILKGIKEGLKAVHVDDGMVAEFFRLNDRKLDALIKATTNDMEQAETAILRRANDQYRKIIYNAQVYANTGAGTYEKAIDMATHDMLAAGLKCVTYSNGTMHKLSDYASMALRTASKRAYLQGEGVKRQEWGICTVVTNKRGCPCTKCLPFVGKIFIDDVWSGGPKSGISPVTGKKYPLISDAIAAGFYHPNCRDSHTTYFEGISTPPDSKYSKEELREIADKSAMEIRAQYAGRQVEKFERLAENSLDSENQKAYQSRANEWTSKTRKMAVINGNSWEDTELRIVSKDEIKTLREYAKQNGVNATDFSAFDGDSELLKAEIDTLRDLIVRYPVGRKVTLAIGELDDDDFAITRNRTITLNNKMLRKRDATERNIMAGNLFASTKAEDIVAHEYGHVLQTKIGGKTLDIMKEAYYNLYKKNIPDFELFEYVQQTISNYALEKNEFIPEIMAKSNGNDYVKACLSVIERRLLQ